MEQISRAALLGVPKKSPKTFHWPESPQTPLKQAAPLFRAIPLTCPQNARFRAI
jgi:hypothetical protein